jgi:hypothetical protein
MLALYLLAFIAVMLFTVAASKRPSAAVISYPWCANYNDRSGYGPGSCGSTSLQQCLATLPQMVALVIQTPPTTLTPQRRRIPHRYGGDCEIGST